MEELQFQVDRRTETYLKFLMDLETIGHGPDRILHVGVSEGLKEVRPPIYRASLKVRSMQQLCHLDTVFLRHITAAFQPEGAAKKQQEEVLSRQEVIQTLSRMFQNISMEGTDHVTSEAPEETSNLMFRLYNRSDTSCLSAASLQTALIALSAEGILVKYRALVSLAETNSGCVSRSGLRSLLQDLSQVPAAAQEGTGVFGGVEVAVSSCFHGVLTPTASEKHVLLWLKSEPRLLLWLPTIHRLSDGQKITHRVRCHACKTFPITGLRFRCRRCLNVQLCLNCFLSEKHKKHPVIEFSTQPTWRESLSSLLSSTRHALLPRRRADRRVPMLAEPGEPNLSSASPPTAATEVTQDASELTIVTQDASEITLVTCDVSGRPHDGSKSLQTDNSPQQAASLLDEVSDVINQAPPLLAEVRNLQREKWLLEQQLQAWRLAVQSGQGVLEDRCSDIEVTMETLKEHNLSLQKMITQAVNKMAACQHTNVMPQHHITATRSDVTPMSDSESSEEEGSTCDSFLCHPIEKGGGAAEVGPQYEDTCLSEEEEKVDCGICSPDELLQETVERLKTDMEIYGWSGRQTVKKRVELLEAADQVGDSIHHLLDAVRIPRSIPR